VRGRSGGASFCAWQATTLTGGGNQAPIVAMPCSAYLPAPKTHSYKGETNSIIADRPARMPAHEVAYLKETVGEALARGCAATIGAQPNDPVEYLGLWLLK
jgi:hypothetical protein